MPILRLPQCEARPKVQDHWSDGFYYAGVLAHLVAATPVNQAEWHALYRRPRPAAADAI